jgi:hypothetical protein
MESLNKSETSPNRKAGITIAEVALRRPRLGLILPEDRDGSIWQRDGLLFGSPRTGDAEHVNGFNALNTAPRLSS